VAERVAVGGYCRGISGLFVKFDILGPFQDWQLSGGGGQRGSFFIEKVTLLFGTEVNSGTYGSEA
jgi:hypothetical protein